MASYSLQPTDYAIVKDNGSPFDDGSISVSLQDDKDSPRIHLFSGDDFVEVALEQWPLIIEAVDKLLNKGAAKLANVEVSLAFLQNIDFDKEAARQVLNGSFRKLEDTMYWERTAQGVSYWWKRCQANESLSNEDKALLQSWIDAANHYGL